MNTNSPEKQLKQLFAELRVRDQQRAPSFQATCQRAVERRPAPPSLVLRLAISAPLFVVAACALIVVMGRTTNKSKAVLNAPFMISKWQSPTDFLLKMPGEDFLATVPQLPATTLETLSIGGEEPSVTSKEKL
jgi:hypothetical protein